MPGRCGSDTGPSDGGTQLVAGHARISALPRGTSWQARVVSTGSGFVQDPTNYLQHPIDTLERISISSVFCAERDMGEPWMPAAAPLAIEAVVPVTCDIGDNDYGVSLGLRGLNCDAK